MILQKKNLNFLILYRPQPTTRSFSAINHLIEVKTTNTFGFIKKFVLFRFSVIWCKERCYLRRLRQRGHRRGSLFESRNQVFKSKEIQPFCNNNVCLTTNDTHFQKKSFTLWGDGCSMKNKRKLIISIFERFHWVFLKPYNGFF